MIYFSNGQFHFHLLRASFRAHGEPTSKYTDDRKYWEDFVARWWHHDSLQFEPTHPTPEQQSRLNHLNQQPGLNELYGDDAAMYVEYGVIIPDTDVPFLQVLYDADATLSYFKDVMKEKARQKRWEVGQSGTMIAGIHLRTDETSRGRVTDLVTAVTADPDTPPTDFEAQPGVWHTIDSQTAIAIGKALRDHVHACFTRCRQFHDAIDDAQSLEDLELIDLDSGWP